MIIEIEMQHVKLNNYEILDSLRSALHINPNWCLYNGKIITEDDFYDEHSTPRAVDFNPEVFKAYQTIRNALLKKQ